MSQPWFFVLWFLSIGVVGILAYFQGHRDGVYDVYKQVLPLKALRAMARKNFDGNP